MEISDNATKIILAIITAVSAIAAIGFTIKVVNRKNKRTNGVDVRHSTVTGDVAGRDINKSGGNLKK